MIALNELSGRNNDTVYPEMLLLLILLLKRQQRLFFPVHFTSCQFEDLTELLLGVFSNNLSCQYRKELLEI